MLTTLTKAGRQAAESVLTIAGVRVGTEEPDYTARPLADGVEVRSYGPRLAAQTTVPADQESARNEGFRRLARFIFGGNDTGDKIAMTAPVAQHENTADDWTISFYMPSDKTLDTLPAPVDDRVTIVELPAEDVAVLRFTGDRGARAVADKTAELLKAVEKSGLRPAGEPSAWFYDPPWTIPFRRRNEVVVPVA